MGTLHLAGARASPEGQQPPSGNEAVSRLGSKILSVDDTPANLFVVRAQLEPLGYEVVDAASGPEALRLAAREEFALILLDVMMPEMDGLETLNNLRGLGPARHTPVILITAKDVDLNEIARAYALGAIDYVMKPVPTEILRGKVTSLVSLYETHQMLRSRDAALAGKDRQIAVLAHDLRNPLNTIVTGMAVLRHGQVEPKAQATMDRVARAADRMTGMIHDLLDYSRAGTGAMPVVPAWMDLGQLCQELVDEFETADASRAIALTIEGDARGEWDPARLYQALSNLVGNATHYGRGRALVNISGHANDVEVVVYNDGAPIPTELLPTIFEPFERGQNDGTGLGLGLYIVRTIARAHGGDVTVESSDLGGTRFSLQLPRAHHPPAPPSAA